MGHYRSRWIALWGILLLSSPAGAFELLDPPRRWFADDLPRTVVVDNGGLAEITDGDGGVTAALAAVEAWNSGPVAHWTSEFEDPGGVGCAGEIYVEAVTTHELGHLIGLGRSTVAPP